jgi:predicted dehydrogenase
LRFAAAADLATKPELPAGVAFLPGARELLERDDVEAVVIATPDSTHFRLAGDALRAGKDVLVEKPMALLADDAVELTETAESLGRVLAVGHTMLYHPGFEELRRGLADGRLGRLERVVMARTSRGASGAGVIADLTPHDIAMAVKLLGEPVAVRAHTSRGRDTSPVPQTGDTIRFPRAEIGHVPAYPFAVCYQLQFARDVVATGWAAWTSAMRVRRFRVECERGSLRFRDEDARPTAAPDSPLGRQLLDFAGCVRTRREPVGSARIGVAVTRCMVALGESLERGGEWTDIGSPALLAGVA